MSPQNLRNFLNKILWIDIITLDVHLHMLFLDGIYVDRDRRFLSVSRPTVSKIMELADKISLRTDKNNCEVEDPIVIKQILSHLQLTQSLNRATLRLVS